MPQSLSLFSMAVWFLVAFCLGAGWHLGVWLMGKLLK